MSRLPIRWRLTLAFALALAVVLTGVGVFLHLQLSTDVDHDIEHDLRTRADQLSGLLMREPISSLPTTAAEQLEPDETIAQILTPTGGVVAATAYADVGLLTPEQTRDAANTEIFVDRSGDAHLDESLRIFAMPVHARDENYIVLVTDSLDERAQTLASTLGAEIVGLAAALIASCGVGYWVAGLALRPVEELRRRAAAISGDDLADAEPGPLPVPLVADEIGRLGRTLNDMLDRIGRAQAGSETHWSGSGASWPTLATSCVLRWRSSRPRWSSPSPERPRMMIFGQLWLRSARKPTGSAGLPSSS